MGGLPVANTGMFARTYGEMCDAIYARLVELNVQQLELDACCGLAAGHTSKILGPKPTKNYGPNSFDWHLQALGLMLIVAPDPERPPLISDSRELRARDATTVVALRKTKRETRELLGKILREYQKKGAKKISAGILAKVSPARRRRSARKAALARWRAVLNAIAAG